MNPHLDILMARAEVEETKSRELWKHDWWIATLLENYRQRFAYVRAVVALERSIVGRL